MIAYIEGLDEFRQGEDVQHYGRIGMKWYEHRFGDPDGRTKYAQKGVQRIGKQEKVSGKQHARAETYHKKAARSAAKSQALKSKFFFKLGAIDDVRERFADKSSYKSSKKAYKAEKKASKADRKIAKTVNFINKHLSDVDYSEMSDEEVATARRYALAFLEKRKEVA